MVLQLLEVVHLGDGDVAWVAQDAHGLHAFLAEEVGQFGSVDAVCVDEAAIRNLGEATGEPTAAYASWGDHPDGDLLPPPPQEPAGRGEPTAVYEVRTYSHDVLWFAKAQDALEALVDQGKPVATLHEVWSHPSQVYHPETEQHEQTVEEVGAALGYGVGHDPHRFHNPFRKREGERLTWVHMPVFLLVTNTSATFCKTVIAAVIPATTCCRRSNGASTSKHPDNQPR